METLLQYFVEYRYLVIFFGTFIEGEVVLIAGGFLVYEGHLNFAILVLIATLAAIIGDNIFFWLGRSQRAGGQHPLANRLLRFIGEHRLFKGEELVRRHGGKSVFLVRFFYGLRFAGAMTAGYLGMGFGRFFLFNLIGSLVWALVIGRVGYLFGQSLEAVVQGVRLAQIGLFLVLAGLVAIYLINNSRKKKALQKSRPGA
ncbi:MAG: DedA family protein [Deltaproteobacteria bacterium]|nr:DedA family protein [Deltaproteobacteria bacterium]